jgi:hypothetical protein
MNPTRITPNPTTPMKTRTLNKIEEAARPKWERRWRTWWHELKDRAPDPARAVMDWALAHHCEGDEFDRNAEAAVESVAPQRGDWTALRDWFETLHERTGDALESGELGTRPTDLPAPPVVPTEEEMSDLVDRTGRTPKGVAAAVLAHVAHTARTHNQFLNDQ